MPLSQELRQRFRTVYEAENKKGLDILFSKTLKDKTLDELAFHMHTNEKCVQNSFLMTDGLNTLAEFIKKRRGRGSVPYFLTGIKEKMAEYLGVSRNDSRDDSKFVFACLSNPKGQNFGRLYLLSWNAHNIQTIITGVMANVSAGMYSRQDVGLFVQNITSIVADQPEDETLDKIKVLSKKVRLERWGQEVSFYSLLKDKDLFWEKFIGASDKAPEGAWLGVLKELNDHTQSRKCLPEEKEMIEEWRKRLTEKHLGAPKKSAQKRKM